MADDVGLHQSHPSASELLEEVYHRLDYDGGTLLDAVKQPPASGEEAEVWLEKGDWLTLAREVGADKVLFVNNDPVIVFYRFDRAPTEQEQLEAFRRAWCMARPQCLFLAQPGELRVYSLNQPPARNAADLQASPALNVVQRVADVADQLAAYNREQVETGRLFADERFGDIDQRADRRLIRDLQVVRGALLETGLEARYVHALIGRSIFVRYLEDREVLTPTYFDQVAAANPRWQQLLAVGPEKLDVGLDWERRRYDRVLRDKEFTYALFRQLAEDFNGDMFPRDEDEEQAISQHHCDLLRGFLLGDVDPYQKRLFFWAYDFRIIPIGLISSLYETFYHHVNQEDKGTHYTPGVLIDYVLSQVLTKQRLDTRPRIIDPACGSGAFLVEAFRRIVRHRVGQFGRPLYPDELQHILRTQIVGIDINEEAIRVAAFSLYLALLNYQEPPDILTNKRLPHVIHVPGRPRDEHDYRILYHVNAFGLTISEVTELAERMNSRSRFVGRMDLYRLLDAGQRLELDLNEFDVVVGNPPWFEAASDHQALRWAKAFGWPIGDKNYSQLFIGRALSLVRPGGIIGFLVHSSVLFNQRTTSKEFRQVWLSASSIRSVTNFVQVRRLFFENAIAPFVFVAFEPRTPSAHVSGPAGEHFVYTSMRLTKGVERLRSVILTAADRRLVRQADVERCDYLWKTYWWGSHRDAALLAALDAEECLGGIVERGLAGTDLEPGYGFQRGDGIPGVVLRTLRPLGSRRLRMHGPLQNEWFEESPRGVKRQPDERLYQGQRLIVGQGTKVPFGVIARLEYDDFSFRHTIYGIPLSFLADWQAKLIVGIFWSALGRYRLFMTSGTWGTWYDKIVPNDILSMPIRLPNMPDPTVDRIVSFVDSIRTWRPDEQPSHAVIDGLTEAVFDLFDLSKPQRDLVRDFDEYAYDMFTWGTVSSALQQTSSGSELRQGVIRDLMLRDGTRQDIEWYLEAFLEVWNRELERTGEFRWRVLRSPDATMLAVLFTTQEKGAPTSPISVADETGWAGVLERCGQTLRQPVSQRVYVDGMVRAVTDTEIIIIKRDERRVWTRSAAREDAEATMVQVMQLRSVAGGTR